MQRFESERLYFEYLNESHFDLYVPQEMDAEVMRYIRKPSRTIEEARVQFDKYLTYMKNNPPFGVYAVYEKASKQFVGLGVLIHLEMDPSKHDRFEVGYRFEKSAWGKGYATELTHAFLKHSFETLKLSEVLGTTQPDNFVSQKVLMKAGLKDLGTSDLRGGCRLFRISKEEYESSK